MTWFALLIMISASVSSSGAAPLSQPLSQPPLNCGCSGTSPTSPCGIQPAFFSRDRVEIERELGFSIPTDDLGWSKDEDHQVVLKRFVHFLENTDHAWMINSKYYTRAAKDVSALTLNSTFKPKNPSETDEYLRCTLPSDQYCLYRGALRPYIGLASKVSKIPYSFLACQSYVESRFDRNARSSVGAIGYAQIKETNVQYLNEILRHSIHLSTQQATQPSSANRSIAGFDDAKTIRIKKAQSDIANIWKQFWAGTKKAPARLEKCDLTCYRQVFLAQALSLKTDMLTLATSSKGLVTNYDEAGDFRIENMDSGDSILLLAGSYNVGVTNMIRLISRFCSGSTKLKDCLNKMESGTLSDPSLEQARKRDVPAFRNYIMRIRDCSQQFSAEQIDFDDDARWTDNTRSEKYNQQRDHVVQCLTNPCPFRAPSSN